MAKMKNQRGKPIFNKGQTIVAKLGNARDYREAISEAIKKRAYEIYQRQGCRPGRDKENWRLAEREILPPLTCGILKSKGNVIVGFPDSVFGAEEIEKVEICVEPHRLIVVGTRRLGAISGENTNFYRVLSLKEEFDPNSATLRQNGSSLEIEVRKSQVSKKSAAAGK
jgi:Protein of unknown function (DUF2934)